jgi:hypothetical protein
LFSNGEKKDVILNRIASSGGGICVFEGASPYICSNVIDGNGAEQGGGIGAMWSCGPFIMDDNIITGNTGLGSSGRGGGIHCQAETVVTIKHNIITDNTAPSLGGGICIDGYGRAAIDSCTISNNIGDGVGCVFPDYVTMHYNNISGNDGYGVRHIQAQITIDAENNWWGDPSGPYHPALNPGGLGDTVSDYIDFDPWSSNAWRIEEEPIVKQIEVRSAGGPTIFSGPLKLPKGKKCKVFDITGRIVEPTTITRGIYFIEIDNEIVQKVIKVR